MPRTLPGLASSPAGAPHSNQTSHISNDCRRALLCSLQSREHYSRSRQAHCGSHPPVRVALFSDCIGGMPHRRWGLRPPACHAMGSVGAWHLPDICKSNRRPRTWRERCKAAPLGCGLLRERLGGRPASRGWRALPTSLWELRGGRRIAPRGAPWPRPGLLRGVSVAPARRVPRPL